MKKVLSIFLALIMVLSIGTVGVSAFDFYDPPICIATYPYHVRKGDVVYYPYEFKNKGKDFYKLCEDEGIDSGEVKLRFRYSYDAESLELVDVYPDKDLYEAGGTAKIIERYTDEESYSFKDFYVVEVTFDLTSYIPDGEYLFNTCFNVLEENFYYMGISTHLISDKSYAEGETYEEFKDILCEVTDENGQVHDMSKYFTWSAIIIDDGFNSYDDLLIKNYEPFIPPVEDDNVENGIYDRITISSDVYHARKGDYAYFPVYYDCKTAYSEIADNDSGSSTKMILSFLYNDHLIEPVEAIPSEQLYNIGGAVEIIKTDKYVYEGTDFPYIYVEVNFDGCIDINNDVLFNVKFEVISENFFDEYGRLDMGGLFDEFYLVDDDNVMTYHFAEWKINKSNGKVKDISPYVTTNSVTQFIGGTYDDLLLKDYEPFIPPVEETVLNIGTTDPINVAIDETKTYKFIPEKNGDFKITVSATDKAALYAYVYKNGELTEKKVVLKWGKDFPFPFVDKSMLNSTVDFELRELVAGDEIVLKLSDETTSESNKSQILKDWLPYFTPSTVTITVEDITPLFRFGVTDQHIRKDNGLVYYPAAFGFDMYDDPDFRYSDICKEVANDTKAYPSTVTAKYIYDSTTLDFIAPYTSSQFVDVKVLRHGSTGTTGPEGQVYNYVIIQAVFNSLAYADGRGPYYLKFRVLEDNFINADGTIRTVVDNALVYNVDTKKKCFTWEAGNEYGEVFDFSDKVQFRNFRKDKQSYTYDDLLIDEYISDIGSYINTVLTSEHARVDKFAYYPVEYQPIDGTYESWVKSLTGYTDGSTRVRYRVVYDSSTLDLIDALPSKELYDLGGTVTVIEQGLSSEDYPDWKYAIIQIDFDGFGDLGPGYLLSLKFNVLKENFVDEDGRAINLVNLDIMSWTVINNEGKSTNVSDYVFTDIFEVAGLTTYSDLIIEGYEPFDPTLISDVTEVTYVQQEDTHKTFTVTANGRKQMIQFIEPDGGTRTYDRYNKNVKITSYNADGEVVSAMSRDLAYEVWEIYSNMSVGVEIKVRGKENYKWDEAKYSFTIAPYNPVILMELSSDSGKKGPVPATVIADEKTEKVMFKMPNGTSVTVSTFTTDENGNRVFTGNAWMNEDGVNEIQVLIRRKNVWKPVGTLEYTVE